MNPYPYQERVAALILKHTSVVLQAPTGAGKTRAALLPFLHAWQTEDPGFPKKCIYVVPMRVLANQFEMELSDLAESYQRRFRRRPRVTILTGERPEDRRFEGDLIFCTVDQFLSSYLMMPYSQPHRLANINAGATVGAYIVFDEFHLLDPESTLPSVMHVLKRLGRTAPVLLMTATFSTVMLKHLARQIGAESMLLPSEEIQAIDTRGGMPPRERRWRVAPDPLTAEAVLARHRTRSLVICNTVKRARELYRDIRAGAPAVTQVALLHSQFLREDRNRTETELRLHFGKAVDRSLGNHIVIATQTIEVGVDVSAETLHTELAPASSLIQRAGRCARYPGERGDVVVYPVESFAPYHHGQAADSLWKREMLSALDWLRQHDNEHFDFAAEQTLVDAVGMARDSRVMANLSAGEPGRNLAIRTALQGETEGASRLLVRDADSRLVLIHPDPDQLLDSPFTAIGFSLQPESVLGMARAWLNRPGAALVWRVKGLTEEKADGRGDGQRIEYCWRNIDDARQILSSRVIVVHPSLAGYSPQEGFLPDRGGTDFISTVETKGSVGNWERPGYRIETYEEHIRLVLKAFVDLALPELGYAAPALERAAGWPVGMLTRAAWLTCLLHDVGKLSVSWQGWAHAYQKQIGQPLETSFSAAHTTYDQHNPAHTSAEVAIRGVHPKPPHAGEGALACAKILVGALDNNHDLTSAVLTAIARHHTPFATECQPFRLRKDAAETIRTTLVLIPEEAARSIDLTKLDFVPGRPEQFGHLLATPDKEFGWLAYALLARALRRSDQRGTELGTQG